MAVSMIGPKFYAWDRNGSPLAFGKVYTYQARTNEPKPTYQSEDQKVENTNPVILNGEGYANIYLSGSYKIVLKDADDNEIWSADPVSEASAGNGLTYVLTAYYLTSSSFKVLGDHLSAIAEGSRVEVGFISSESKQSTVLSATYDGEFTIVGIEDSIITTDINTASLPNGIIALEDFNDEKDALFDEFQDEAANLIYSVGFKNTGVFGVGAIVNSAQETLTYNNEEYNTTAGPFPVTVDASTPDLDSEDWFNVTLEARKTVARSLNAIDSDVIYSTDKSTSLTSVKYIYTTDQQVIYRKPANVAAGATIDTVVGSTLTTTSPVESFEMERVDSDPLTNVDAWGAVGDGADTGTEFTGTDNRLAFANCLDYCESNRKIMTVPDKTYRIGYIYTGTNKTSLTLTGSYYRIVGKGTLLIDDDLNDTNGLDYCFGNSSLTSSIDVRQKDLYEIFEMRGLTVKGRWSHSPSRRGIRPISVAGFKQVDIEHCKFYDHRNKAAIGYCNDQVNISNNSAERIGPGAFRMQESNNILANKNFIKDGADDSLDFHTNDAILDTAPSRTSIVVTNNILEKTEGVVCLGAKLTIVANNTFKIPVGNTIVVGSASGVEGDTASYGVIVTGNTIIDPLEALVDGETELPSFNTNQGVIYVGSAEANGESLTNGTIAGDYDSAAGAFLYPWNASENTPAWGASNTNSDGTISVAKGRNFIISDNIVMRTLPSVTAFSDWGFGDYFTFSGWADPVVADDNYRANGVVLLGDIVGYNVHHNEISDLAQSGIYFRGDISLDRTRCFQDILVSNNIITNVPHGAMKDNIGVASFDDYDDWTITFSGNTFNLDPYHKAPNRTQPLDGTWSAIGNLTYSGILMRGGKNMIMKGNTFENCYRPIQGNSNLQEQFLLEGNIVRCEPVNNSYDSGNKGVATPEDGTLMTHMIVENDPTSASYGKLINNPLVSSGAMPSSGTYMQEHFVRNIGSSQFLGWRRMTTGSDHVLGVDWIEVG